jgi:rubrerythrin
MALITSDTPLEKAWKIAIERETAAHAFYAQASQVVKDSALQSLFTFLAAEEQKHMTLLQDEYDKTFTPDN